MSQSNLSRRSLLGLGAAAAGAALVPVQALGQQKRRKGQPKNIILLVSDGMSAGVPAMANALKLHEQGKETHWEMLMKADGSVHGYMDTRSLSSLVTDSAAASSAWSSGVYNWNKMLNTLPDGTELTPILPLLKQMAKMKTGIISTASITHATPAGFCIADPDRNAEARIAGKYLNADLDVILGGGSSYFSEELRQKFVEKGYSKALNAAELDKIEKGRVLGLFATGQVPYEIDRVNSFSLLREVPSLAAMAKKGLELLNQDNSNGFFVQIEGARIDHAAHWNDVGGTLYDQLAFDEAVAVALEFARKDGNTLVVVTSDHANSNPGIIGAGKEYFDSTAGLYSVSKMKKSYEMLLPMLTGKSNSEIASLIEEYLGCKLTASELGLIADAVNGKSALKEIDQYQITGSMLGIVTSNHTHVCWSGRQHANDHTIITSTGPGAELFGGLITNVSFKERFLSLRGLKHENPKMSYEDAVKFKDKVATVDQDIHWM